MIGVCMSTVEDKFKHSKRLQKDQNAINRQVNIAKSHGTFNVKNIEQPHRLVKHHAMDCGTPGCYLCANPRRNHKDKLTQQEKKFFQDVDSLQRSRGNIDDDNED